MMCLEALKIQRYSGVGVFCSMNITISKGTRDVLNDHVMMMKKQCAFMYEA